MERLKRLADEAEKQAKLLDLKVSPSLHITKVPRTARYFAGQRSRESQSDVPDDFQCFGTEKGQSDSGGVPRGTPPRAGAL